MPLIVCDEILAKLLQNLAPIVLGIISDTTNINKVRIADTTPKDASPNILTACAPTPAAPMVCATVFKDKIADNGLSMLFFKSMNVFAQAFPSSCLTIRNDWEVESRTASITEHRKETNNARNK